MNKFNVLIKRDTRFTLYIIIAFILWLNVFVLQPFNFWVTISLATSLMSLISLSEYKNLLSENNWTKNNILIGIFSAIILYGIFFIGKWILDNFGIIPNYRQNISYIYANRGIIPRWIICILLIFPISFGEEVFWRGCIQKYFYEKYNSKKSLFITTALYTAIHIPTLNPILILSALLVGIYWGAIFTWRKSVIPSLISHMLWDPLIFIIFPIN